MAKKPLYLLSDEGTGLFVKHNSFYTGEGNERARYYAEYGPHEAALLTDKQADRLLTRAKFGGFIKISFEPWLVARKIANHLGFKQPHRYQDIEDAFMHLIQNQGYSATEAQRRLTAVTDMHGLTLTSEQYIKLALNHSK